MSDDVLYLIVSLPIGAVSAIITTMIMLKFKPAPKRTILIGICSFLIGLGVTVGLVLINIWAGIVVAAILLPALAVWIWFMTRPFIKSANEKTEKVKQELENKKRNRRRR